jgi:hypothetical protein
VRAVDADAALPASQCWADEFARLREATDAYVGAVRKLAVLTRRSTAGVAAFLVAADRGACACRSCADVD